MRPQSLWDVRVELCSASKASESISMLVHEALPAGEPSQVKREEEEEEGEEGRWEKTGRDEEQQQAFLLLH